MKKDAEIKVRIPSEVKKQATELYSTLGLSMSAAVELFLRASIREGGLPIELKIKPAKERGAVLAGEIDEDGNTVWPAEDYYEGDDIYDDLYPGN